MVFGHPYVAITGFRSREEIRVCEPYVQPLNRLGYHLQIGLLVLREEMRHLEHTLKHPKRMVWLGRLSRCPITVRGMLTFVHFCSKQPETASETLFWDLGHIVRKSAGLVDGFQLNLPWPTIPARDAFGHEVRMVLQIGPAAMEACRYDSNEMIRRIAAYVEYDAITDLLVDPSAGQGLEFGFDFVHELVAKLQRAFPSLGIGVAGGLTPQNLRDKLECLLLDFPRLSFDIETGVRDPEDNLDPGRVRAYLETAIELIRECRRSQQSPSAYC